MPYGVRVCFRFTEKGSLSSELEYIEFNATLSDMPFKLSAGGRGDALGASERFSVSSEPFASSEEAREAGESVRHALLLISARTHRGLDLGQNSLRSFGISQYGKKMIADAIGAQAVVEDHLGITVYPTDPKARFVRMDMKAVVGRPAQAFVTDLAALVGRYRLASSRAEIAAGLYALSHFVGRAPARFLMLFVALEALLEPSPRSPRVRDHVDALISNTKMSALSDEEKMALCSALSFQKAESIAATGRSFSDRLLSGSVYDSLSPVEFFSKIYRVRNDLVHRGLIDPGALQSLVGEVDRFVGDLISKHAAVS
jgi:hypothetical protein